MSGKTILKILIIFIATVIVLLLGALFYIPSYINEKITSAVNNNTEFRLEIGQVSFSGHRSLELRGITLQHKLDKEDYIKNKGFQTDWVSCKVTSLFIYDIDWSRLIFDKNFFAERILINTPDIYVFRDKRIPPKYVYKALPAALLRDGKFPFSVPVIEIADGKVIYEEVTKKTEEKIRVPFDHLFAMIHHMSSDSLYLLDQPVMWIEARASIFDSVKTVITYTANTLNRNNVFSLEGNMQSFSATLLNRCITPATHVIIDKGFVNRIYFKFIANENVANGTINLNYKHLKLKVLKKEKKENNHGEEEEPKKSRFKSFLANLFVRDKGKQPNDSTLKDIPRSAPQVYNYTGEIHFERRKDRFIFNYWWNSFKSGVASTVVKVPVTKTQK
jgi:hypothetical protein